MSKNMFVVITEDGTIFRRQYYKNGTSAGFIFYNADATELVDAATAPAPLQDSKPESLAPVKIPSPFYQSANLVLMQYHFRQKVTQESNERCHAKKCQPHSKAEIEITARKLKGIIDAAFFCGAYEEGFVLEHAMVDWIKTGIAPESFPFHM
ncbi:hypothetical protein [Edaphovirga cremea]|uniref:hypothetical protein n=1 Tax=Edaphovirga cremea TaxID=2267246 RepID=UPI003988BCC4